MRSIQTSPLCSDGFAIGDASEASAVLAPAVAALAACVVEVFESALLEALQPAITITRQSNAAVIGSANLPCCFRLRMVSKAPWCRYHPGLLDATKLAARNIRAQGSRSRVSLRLAEYALDDIGCDW
jgi:hypothetical protein